MATSGAQQAERGCRVHVHHRVPLLVAVIDDARIPDVARVVDEDVQVAEAAETFGDGAIAEVLLGDVPGKHLARAAGSGHIGAENGQPVAVEVVGENHGTFRGQLERDLAADPLACAGDERHPAVELAVAHRGPRSAASHSSMPSTMTPLAAFGWMSQRPWAAAPTGGRSMIGSNCRSSALPVADTSSVTTARW